MLTSQSRYRTVLEPALYESRHGGVKTNSKRSRKIGSIHWKSWWPVHSWATSAFPLYVYWKSIMAAGQSVTANDLVIILLAMRRRLDNVIINPNIISDQFMGIWMNYLKFAHNLLLYFVSKNHWIFSNDIHH